jgi:GH35 family endo-1,4-beta-xylanase
VSITSPAGGATFAAPAQVPVTVNTADSDGSVAKVEFFDGTTKLGETSTAPFSFTTPALGPGAHSLTAVATDNQGATQNSSAVSITVTGPLVSVTATGPNASENGAPGVFTFTRDQTTGPLSVNYALSGTAIAGLDYVAPSGTVSFADGQSSATLTVTPLADTFIDPNDTVIATVTPGTAYGLGAPSGATVTITDTTTSPLSVVPKNPLATAPSGFGAATRSVVSVAGQGFAQALRIVTPDTSASIYEDGYSSAADIALTQPVTQGDTLVVSFWAHALTGDANGNAFLRPRIESTASVSSGERPTTVGSDWRFVRMFITMAGSYAAGGARLRIFAGYGPQTIEIGGITAVDYGRVAYSSLGLPLYEGRDLTADWRTAAAQRIDQYRKANLTVQVRDLGGNPMPGAAVHVKMKRHAFGFGSAVKATLIVSTDTSEGNYLNSQTYRDKITSIFNWIVLENELKWTSWEPADGSFNKTTPLGALAWLHDNQLSGFRGHNLIWPRWPTTEQHLPAWLQADYNSQIAANGQSAADAWLRARVLSHISGEASDVGTNVSRWDVLNEPFANHDLQDLYGRAEQAAWFQAARSAAPVGTPLVLNDYDNQGEDLPHINFLLQTLQLIDAVQPAALVDGVGIQSHLDINTMPTPDGLFANLNRYAALGKQIEITEFDIDTLGDEQLQSDVLRDYMTLSFSHPAVKAFLQWGFWAGAHYAPPKAIYNADWSPKLAANTWSDLIYHQWWTDVNTTADANGNVSLRGFQGDYDIIATTATRAVTVPTTLGAADATVTVVPREQVSVTLAPTADAYVRDGSFANTACGATDASELVVNASPANGGFNRDSYLQFDLSSVPSMFSAKLRVNAALSSVNGSTATYVVGLSACSVPSATWTESSLTWNNRPALGSVLDNANVTGAMPSPTAQWVEFDVTSWLQSEKAAGRNVVSLALHCEVQANPSIVISSREAANSALRPQLVVVTAQLPTVTVAATAPNTAELGPVPGTFTLSRTGDASVPLNISGNLGGTAIAGTDYTITGPPFNFPANAATLAVNVVPIPNDIAQGDRSVSLALQSGAAYLLGSPASASITIADKPADAWRYLTFGASANSPAIAGDLADPNHNGLANLVEYALGGDPLGNSTGLAVLPVAGRDAQGRLTLRFARYLSHSDLTLIVQGADAPAGPWADLAQSTLGSAFAPLVGGVDVSESGSGGQRTVTVSDAFALGDPVHPKRFLRLKFAR